MMQKQIISYLSVLFLTFTIIFSGCAPTSWKQADRAYKQGDMVRAVEYSVRTLRQKHGYERAVHMLKNILEPTYENLYTEAQRNGNRGDWDNAYQTFRTIERLSNMVGTLPEQPDPAGGTIKFHTVNVRNEVDNAIDQAAEMHYQNGLDLEERGRNREAARAFTMAMSYIPNYRDASDRYIVTREAATKRVSVLPFENITGQPLYGAVGEILADNCISIALSDRRNLEFLDIITRDRLHSLLSENRVSMPRSITERTVSDIGSQIGIHSFVIGRILSIDIHYPPETRDVIYEEAEISERRGAPKDTVSATVTVTSRRALARMVTSYEIVDVAMGTTVRTANIPQEVEIVIEFASFRGDERALSNRSRRLVNTEPAYPPSENELVLHLTELVAEKLSRDIIAYFN